MKAFVKFISVLIFIFSLSISAQKKTWLNTALKETNKVSAVYYKVISADKKKVDYFYKSGKIFRQYNYSNRKIIGKFSEFYETGELKVLGKYKNGLKEDIWKTFYKNGKIKEKGKYVNGEKVGVWKSFYKNF